ncbi:MAG TPA: hypothetical protein VFU29_00230 [Chitinophagaceae bacterium]|nr:hypothetical protein [Chitinophagaceae bacterium]
MLSFYFKEPKEEKKDSADKQIEIQHIESVDYSAEGSEFLDDSIRTNEQPLAPPEESVAAGSPEGLL